MRQECFEGHDGLQLSSYLWGSGQRAAVIINALGMPVDLIQPLAARLSQGQRVVSWESRGWPGPSPAAGAAAWDLPAHQSDYQALLRHHGIQQPVLLVTWCSGATLGLQLAGQLGASAPPLTLISPNGGSVGGPETPLERDHRQLYELALARPERAAMLVRGLQALVGKQLSESLNPESSQAIRLTMGAMESADALLRQARLMVTAHRDAAARAEARLIGPLLLVTGLEDRLASPAVTDILAARYPHAELLREPAGDHYLPYHSRAVASGILAFQERYRAGRSSLNGALG